MFNSPFDCNSPDDYLLVGAEIATAIKDVLASKETKELVISKVKYCPAPYQSMYIHSETQAEEYQILGVASVERKEPEHYILANRNHYFISGTNTFEEAVQQAIEYGMAASEVQMNVQVTTPSMSQEELDQLKNLLNKARSILDSPEANVFVCNSEDDRELVLFGECTREGIYRTVSSQGVNNEFM